MLLKQPKKGWQQVIEGADLKMLPRMSVCTLLFIRTICSRLTCELDTVARERADCRRAREVYCVVSVFRAYAGTEHSVSFLSVFHVSHTLRRHGEIPVTRQSPPAMFGLNVRLTCLRSSQ